MPGKFTPRDGTHGPLADELICFKRLMDGERALTITLATSVLPVPPLVEPTVTELTLSPAVAPVTLTVNVHVEPAVRLAPLKLTVEEPAVAEAVPPQVLVRFGVAATTNPVGSESVKLTPVSVETLFGLLMENVRVVELPV